MIEKYSSYPQKRQYESIISALCEYTKDCALKYIYNPYIQLKDDKGNFVFNDRMCIEIKGDRESLKTPKNKYSVNFIDDMKDKNKVFCMLTYFSDQGKEVSFGGITFRKDKSEIGLMDYMNAAGQSLYEEIIELQRQGQVFEEEINLSVNFLLHQYNAHTKTWIIASPLDSISLIDESGNF